MERRKDDVIAEGNEVVSRGTFRSVHKGEFLGVPATNKEMIHTWTVTFPIQAGKIVDRWANANALTFIIGLGMIPPPGEGRK